VSLTAIVGVVDAGVGNWFCFRVDNHTRDVFGLRQQQILKGLGMEANHREDDSDSSCRDPSRS